MSAPVIHLFPYHAACSPSGRYALGWAVPDPAGHGDHVDDRYRDFADRNARDYIVERRTRRIVGTLPLHTRSFHDRDGHGIYKSGGRHYWVGHQYVGLSACWSHDERWVLVCQSDKWWFNALWLGHRRRDRFAIVEIGDAVEDYVRNAVRRRAPAAYRRYHQRGHSPFVNIDDSAMRLERDRAQFPFETGAVQLARDPERDPVRFSGTIELQIVANGSEITARPANLRILSAPISSKH